MKTSSRTSLLIDVSKTLSLTQIQAREKALEFERAMQAIDEEERRELAKIAALMREKQVSCPISPIPDQQSKATSGS